MCAWALSSPHRAFSTMSSATAISVRRLTRGLDAAAGRRVADCSRSRRSGAAYAQGQAAARPGQKPRFLPPEAVQGLEKIVRRRFFPMNIYSCAHARVVELVDTADSKSAGRK